MALESSAFFAKRVSELGLQDFMDQLTEQGWNTMGMFAFAASYIPGSSDDSQLVKEVVVPVLG
eukprot:952751-Karenia_brevis.AAC.1